MARIEKDYFAFEEIEDRWEISRRDLAMLQRTKPQACLKLMMGVVERIGEGVRNAQEDLRDLLVQ